MFHPHKFFIGAKKCFFMPPYDPFASYVPKRFCPKLDQLVDQPHCATDVFVAAPFAPDIQLTGAHETTVRTVAQIPGFKYVLGDSRDLFAWKDSVDDFPPHFQGRIGERVLTVILEALARECVVSSIAAGFAPANGKVLREKRHYREARGDIVYWNNDLVLKFQRRTTFKLLQKVRGGSREFRYRQHDIGLELAEIDGLAYLHLGTDKYLIVGEVKTTTNASTKAWEHVRSDSASGTADIAKRLLNPLKSLYPDHHLVYAVTGYASSLFVAGGYSGYQRLQDGCSPLIAQLLNEQIIPLVCVIKNIDCAELARKFYQQLQVTKEMLKALDRSRRDTETADT